MNRKKEILNLFESGLTYEKIGNKFGVSRQRIHQIITGYKSPLTIKRRLEVDIKSLKKLEKINKLLKEKLNLNFSIGNISTITGMKQGSRDRNRELIRIRDNHTCQICGRVWRNGERRFDIHHLDEDNNKTRRVDNLDTESKNMITLCHRCHLNLPGHREKMTIKIQKRKVNNS